MKLGFCSNAFTRCSLEESIQRIGALGYPAIELLCDAPHFWPEAEPPARVNDLRRALDDAGLRVSNVNANTAVGAYVVDVPENVFGPSLSSPDPEVRARRVRHAVAALELAAAVGAPSISITSGSVEADHPPEAALAVLLQTLPEVLEAADRVAVDVGIEAEPGLLLESTAEAAAFVESVGHPRLGLNLDIGHAVVAGEDPAAMIERFGPLIWHLHLEDIRDGKHFHRIPGDGDVDFAAIATALRSVGFARYASVEVYPYKRDPDAAAARSLEFLARWFDTRRDQ